MDEHQYGPHSSGNLISDGKMTREYAAANAEATMKYGLPRDPLLYTQAQVDALVKAESERRVGDINELRKAVERSVARRCEYLARYRGHLQAAADIRREFELTDEGSGK